MERQIIRRLLLGVANLGFALGVGSACEQPRQQVVLTYPDYIYIQTQITDQHRTDVLRGINEFVRPIYFDRGIWMPDSHISVGKLTTAQVWNGDFTTSEKPLFRVYNNYSGNKLEETLIANDILAGDSRVDLTKTGQSEDENPWENLTEEKLILIFEATYNVRTPLVWHASRSTYVPFLNVDPISQELLTLTGYGVDDSGRRVTGTIDSNLSQQLQIKFL